MVRVLIRVLQGRSVLNMFRALCLHMNRRMKTKLTNIYPKCTRLGGGKDDYRGIVCTETHEPLGTRCDVTVVDPASRSYTGGRGGGNNSVDPQSRIRPAYFGMKNLTRLAQFYFICLSLGRCRT